MSDRGALFLRLHPPFLHFPIAFWISSTALDLVSSATGFHFPAAGGFRLPHALLWAGVIAALPTIAAGLFDYARLPRAVQDARPLKLHMLCMSTAFTLYLGAALWRVKAGGFDAAPPLALLLLEALGATALLVGGHAGGRVVFEVLPRAGRDRAPP